GVSCGNWITMHANRHGRICEVQPQLSGSGPMAPGTHEDANIRGLFIHSMECYRHVVEKEIIPAVAPQGFDQNAYKLTLTKVGNADGPCGSYAKQVYQELASQTLARLSTLQSSLGAKLNIRDIRSEERRVGKER